jgi:phospholipid N-methyltransferase
MWSKPIPSRRTVATSLKRQVRAGASHAARLVNTAMRPLNIQIVPGRTTDPAVQSFLRARKTIARARAAGLSVGDYVDQTFSQPGTTARSVDAMIRISGLSFARRICEIGPGTGRYAEKVIAALKPEAYEIYETADDWLPYLRTLPNAVIQPCDGHTLSATASGSVDLVHANKVFVYIPFNAVMGYVDEMVRVARPGGIIAFDVVTERCLTDEVVQAWIAQETIYRPVPREWLIGYLGRRGMAFTGSHLAYLTDSQTELLVFQKTRTMAQACRAMEGVPRNL